MHQFGVPSSGGWAIRGYQQDNHGLPPLSGGWQAEIVTPLAALGRVLLQFIVPVASVGNAIRGGLRPFASSSISIPTGHIAGGSRGAPAARP
jgi:hypothetical protein